MKQLRIMELRGTYKGGGGPDKTILLSAAKHDRDRFFVLVTYLRDPKDKEFQIAEMASQYGVPDYIEVSDRRMLDLKCLFELNRLIRKYRLELIHVHDQKTTLMGFLLRILNPKVKVMNTAHGWIVNSKVDSLKQKIQYAMLKTFPLHIAVSEATEKLMLSVGFDAKTIKVLYNSIDCNTWSPGNGDRLKIRKEFQIPDDAFVVGTIGRISQEKDLPTFLKVAQRILKMYPQIRFLVVGDGKNSMIVDELKQQAESMGIEHAIIFTGHRTDLLDIYSALDLFLMTSLTEGLPNTVLESMAMGVPVVATSVGGVPELIEHGKNGFLQQPKNVDELTESVIKIVSDKNCCTLLKEKGKETIKKRFSFDIRLQAIENIYLELAQS